MSLRTELQGIDAERFVEIYEEFLEQCKAAPDDAVEIQARFDQNYLALSNFAHMHHQKHNPELPKHFRLGFDVGALAVMMALVRYAETDEFEASMGPSDPDL